MDFMARIRAWEDTRREVERSKTQLNLIPGKKLRLEGTKVTVQDLNSLVAGKALLEDGLRPLVLILADHRFAGGDSQAGSGAQEESCCSASFTPFARMKRWYALRSPCSRTRKRGCARLSPKTNGSAWT